MKIIQRREILQAAASLSLTSVLSRSSLAQEPYSGTREIDISAFDKVLLPREHGQLTSLNRPIFRRYPSRDHCMQMAAFFNDKEGMLVIANDPTAGICDWQIFPNRSLRLVFYGATTNPIILKIEPTVEAAATAYRAWALKQSWVTSRSRQSTRLNFIAVASSTVEIEKQHLERVRRTFQDPIGMWFTLWRKYPFDRMYPDYRAKEPAALADFLSSLDDSGVLTFPYINGLLWDENYQEFREASQLVALRTQDGRTVQYSNDMPFLKYACPQCGPWQDRLASARHSIRDSKKRITSGIYIDMVGATEPHFCYSTRHGHQPGDPYSWQRGMRSIIGMMDGARMIEGCAEIYLDQVDYALMHLHTDKPDIAPLWTAVYGDIVHSVGWKVPIGTTQSDFQEIQKRIRMCSVSGIGSPWMTTEYESLLLDRKLVTPFQAE